jgi:hypothetical protein
MNLVTSVKLYVKCFCLVFCFHMMQEILAHLFIVDSLLSILWMAGLMFVGTIVLSCYYSFYIENKMGMPQTYKIVMSYTLIGTVAILVSEVFYYWGWMYSYNRWFHLDDMEVFELVLTANIALFSISYIIVFLFRKKGRDVTKEISGRNL